MRAPVGQKPGERGMGSGPMLQRCVEKIMQRGNISETDARHVLMNVVQQSLIKEQPGVKSGRAPPSPRSSCADSPLTESCSPPLPSQLHAFPSLTRSLSPHALASLQTMLSKQSPPVPRSSSPQCRRSPYESPPQSPQSAATADDGSDVDENLIDLTRACFERKCAQLGIFPKGGSVDREFALPLSLVAKAESPKASIEGAAAALHLAATQERPGARPVCALLSPVGHTGGDGKGLVGEGLMEVTLQPGMSSIVDLKSRCTDGLLLLSTTASFVPRSPVPRVAKME